MLAVAVLASGLLLFHLTRGSSFWADDWIWITTRRANTLGAFLSPYNGHLSLVPIAIYRLMFAVFGIGSYTPYRALVIALSLLVAVLLFAYARSRVGGLVALPASVSMLFLGPGWQDTMWAFQIPWLVVCAAAIGALMLIDRRTRLADAGACALVLVAITSTSLGIAFAIGIAVDLAVARRRWRDAWIVGVPFALYAIWSLHYRPGLLDASAIPTIPVSIAKAVAAALSALTGVSGIRPFDEVGTSLTYGWPLFVVAALVVFRRARTVRPPARAVSLAATLAVLAASVTVVHGELADPLSSRYIYVYCLLVALVAVELARGIRPSRFVQAALCVATLVAVLANIGILRAAGAYIRESGAITNAALTALDLDRAHVSPNTVVRMALYQFLGLSAQSVLDAEQALGSPAYTLAQLRRADAGAQSTADSQLLADRDVALGRAPALAGTPRSSTRSRAALPVVGFTNGTIERAGPCIRFTPAAALAPGSAPSVSLATGPGDLAVTPTAAPETLSFRRFATTLTPLGTVAARASALLKIRPDLAPNAWYVEISGLSAVRVCALAP